MSLYGRTDSNANKAKAGIGIAASAQAKQTIFIDDTEAALAENKARGLNAPGWWSYYTFTDCDGNTRHKAEMLVTIAGPEANSDETQADDAVAADRTVVISSQPALESAVSIGAPATFTVSASIEGASGGSITAQWQASSDGGSNFTNISSGQPTGFGGTYLYQGSGFSGQELFVTGTASPMNNYQYRIVLSTAGDSGDVTSDAATLTFS